MTSAGPDPPRGPGPAFFRRRLIVAGVVVFVIVMGGLIATWAVQRYVTFPQPPASAWNPAARAADRALRSSSNYYFCFQEPSSPW